MIGTDKSASRTFSDFCAAFRTHRRPTGVCLYVNTPTRLLPSPEESAEMMEKLAKSRPQGLKPGFSLWTFCGPTKVVP